MHSGKTNKKKGLKASQLAVLPIVLFCICAFMLALGGNEAVFTEAAANAALNTPDQLKATQPLVADLLSESGTESESGSMQIVQNPDTGESYCANSAMLLVESSRPQNEVLAALDAAGAQGATLSMVASDLDDGTVCLLAEYENDVDPNDICARMSQSEIVVSAEPDYVLTLCEDDDDDDDDDDDGDALDEALNDATEGSASADVAELQSGVSLSDVSAKKQWMLRSVGAYDAWGTAKSSGNVTVAVIDSGVDYDHVDLKSNLVSSKYAKNIVTGKTGASAVDDENGHGTHVCGIISATSNNSVGVSGVSYNCKVLPIKVTSGAGSGLRMSDVVKSVNYVVSLKKKSSSPSYLKNIRVINLSCAGWSCSSSYKAAINAAHKAGILVVAAAGNGSSSRVVYPAACDYVLGVSGMKSSSNGVGVFDSSYSDYGSYVDLAAPGTKIYSTLPGNKYGYKTGTSMSAAVVSGCAALLFSMDMTATPDGITSLLEETSVDLGNSGWDSKYGYGAVSLKKAVKQMYGKVANATKGWTKTGTCEWRISKGKLTIRPLQNGEEGTLPSYSANNVPWRSKRSIITSVCIKSGVSAGSSTANMFAGCVNLKSVSITKLDTSATTNMHAMFSGCSALTSLNLSSLDTSKVTNMSNLFDGCSSLKSLDLTHLNTAKVTNMSYLFNGCTSLKKLYVGKKWSTKSVSKSTHMFYKCSSLVGGAGTKYSSKHTGVVYARIDKKGSKGYLTLKS